MITGATCPACGRPDAEAFFSLTGLPVHATAVCTSPAEARAQTVGDQDLAVCNGCGFVFNTAFVASLLDYSGHHEESQGFSPTFRAFAENLAADWIERWELAGKTVVEVGCGGRGDFLPILVQAGAGRAHGVDPGLSLKCLVDDPRVTGERAYFTPSEISRSAAAIVCRHTLEHVVEVAGFLDALVRGVDTERCRAILVEVPDVGRAMDDGAFWDFHYEHCSSFTAGSLLALFRRAGLDVAKLHRVYRNQYLVIEADPEAGRTIRSDITLHDTVEQDVERCRAFAKTAKTRLCYWEDWFSRQQQDGREVVVWGGGAKGSVLLNTLAKSGVERVVDINPGLQGQFLSGIGTPIVNPKSLVQTPPATVLLMNGIYAGEVRQMLDGMGLEKVELLTV
jgi:hypothetical protein